MAAPKYFESYTYDDYVKWEGDWELIDGIPVAMAPSPFSIHQMINVRIASILNEELENCENCFVVSEEDWVIDKKNVLRPDCMVVCNDNIFANVTRTPQLIVEVVSNSTIKRDEEIKKEIYEEKGVKTYILIYPELTKAKIYELKDEKYKEIGFFIDETYTTTIENCEVEIDFNKVFSKVRRLMKRNNF